MVYMLSSAPCGSFWTWWGAGRLRTERTPPSKESETGRAGRGWPWRWTGRGSPPWSPPAEEEDRWEAACKLGGQWRTKGKNWTFKLSEHERIILNSKNCCCLCAGVQTFSFWCSLKITDMRTRMGWQRNHRKHPCTEQEHMTAREPAGVCYVSFIEKSFLPWRSWGRSLSLGCSSRWRWSGRGWRPAGGPGPLSEPWGGDRPHSAGRDSCGVHSPTLNTAPTAAAPPENTVRFLTVILWQIPQMNSHLILKTSCLPDRDSMCWSNFP